MPMRVSKGTRKAIGPEYLNFMKKLAGTGEITLPGAIVSRADIFNDKARTNRVFETAIAATAAPFSKEKAKRYAEMNSPHLMSIVAVNRKSGAERTAGVLVHGDYEDIHDLNALPLVPIPNYAETLPGIPQDYERFTLIHEVEHMSQASSLGKNGFDAEQEYGADLKAAEIYYKAYQEGLVTDAEVPYAVRAMRAIGTVMKEDDGYALNGLFPMPGEADIVGNDIDGGMLDIKKSIEYLYANIGHDIDPTKKSVGDLSAIGREAAQGHPELLYKKAKEVLALGGFDNRPVGKQLMENFVDGAERYQFEFFGVALADRPTSRPDIVEALDEQYSPVPNSVRNPTPIIASTPLADSVDDVALAAVSTLDPVDDIAPVVTPVQSPDIVDNSALVVASTSSADSIDDSSIVMDAVEKSDLETNSPPVIAATVATVVDSAPVDVGALHETRSIELIDAVLQIEVLHDSDLTDNKVSLLGDVDFTDWDQISGGHREMLDVHFAIRGLYNQIGLNLTSDARGNNLFYAGKEAVEAQPELLYEKAREMLQAGKFDDNPVTQKFIEKFIESAQRYQPEKFGVDTADIPTSPPEGMESAGRQYVAAVNSSPVYSV